MSSETSTDTHPLASQRRGEHGSDSPLEPWQFFTLAGLIGATIAVFLSQGQSPAGVILLSLMVFGAAGVGFAAWRTFAPVADTVARSTPRIVGGRTRAALEREKVLALRSIKELEFDRAMGKVSEKDFAEMSVKLRARAARLLRQLDASSGYRESIYREIEERVGVGSSRPGRARGPDAKAGGGDPVLGGPPPQGVPGGAAREPGDAVLGSGGDGGPAAYSIPTPTCAACGTSNDTDASFCKRCGARLRSVEAG